nr:unnamed protein product [Digitaria exilis]
MGFFARPREAGTRPLIPPPVWAAIPVRRLGVSSSGLTLPNRTAEPPPGGEPCSSSTSPFSPLLFPPRPPAKMDPFIPRNQEEARRLVMIAQDILSGEITEGKVERSREVLVKALCLDACVLGGHPLLVAAVALRAMYRHRLPSGHPNPYSVFGLIPDVPSARDPARIEAFYRQASDLLNRECLNGARVHHPCYPAFSTAARLVADAWTFLSDPDRKASLDSRFTTAQAVATTPPSGDVAQAAATTPPSGDVAQAAATTTPPSGEVPNGHRASSRTRKPNVRLAGDEWI